MSQEIPVKITLTRSFSWRYIHLSVGYINAVSGLIRLLWFKKHGAQRRHVDGQRMAASM